MRALCVVFWVLSALLARTAWQAGDWRWLIEQFAQALVAALIWLAAPPGAEGFRPLTIGTRRLRLAIYASVLVTASIAASPWPWADSAGGSSAVLMFAAVIILSLLRAEHEATP